MHARLTLALFVSIFLIGGALWVRLSEGAKINYKLAFVERGMEEEELVNYFLEPADAKANNKIVVNSNGTTLGQQLILEYIGLSANGPLSDTAIETLAEKYVENIPTLTQVNKINQEDIQIVQTNKASIQKYTDEITKIHRNYTESILKNYNGTSLETLDAALYSATSNMSRVYENTANKLKKMRVPSTISTLHIELTNTYFANAESMRAISATETDSATAFAGLISLSNNTDREVAILSEIDRELTKGGI